MLGSMAGSPSGHFHTNSNFKRKDWSLGHVAIVTLLVSALAGAVGVNSNQGLLCSGMVY